MHAEVSCESFVTYLNVETGNKKLHKSPKTHLLSTTSMALLRVEAGD